MLAEKYRTEIDTILAQYPAEQKRSAVMPLIYLAQKEYGYASPEAMQEIATIIGVTATDVAGVVGFYSLYYAEKEGKRRLQVCTDLPCALRGADKFGEDLCKKLGVKWHETTKDGEFTVEPVMCLAACDKAPMFQVQDADGIHYHESAAADKPLTVDEAVKILDAYKGKK